MEKPLIYVAADNAKIHKAGVVMRWLADHPWLVLHYLPAYCPRANPIERAFGEVHDNCTRNHKRKRLRDLVLDVDRHFQVNGPWKYKLPSIYYKPEVTVALEKMAAKEEMLAAWECTNLMWTDLVFAKVVCFNLLKSDG